MYYVCEKVILGKIKRSTIGHMEMIHLWNFLPMDAKYRNIFEHIKQMKNDSSSWILKRNSKCGVHP